MKSINKIFLTLTAFAASSMICGVANAENVTQKEASKIAETFFNASYGEVMPAPKLSWNGRQLTTDRLFSPFYVYNHPKGGFVIISADSKAYPIIAYSKTGFFDKDKLEENERNQLIKYAHEIELIRYDSRIPERAVSAWQNMPLYINKVLNNPYNTPEFERLNENQKDLLEEIDRRNNAIFLPSAVEFELYDPENFRPYTLDDVLGDYETEDVPFSFYEEFIAEIKAEEDARLAAFDEMISPSKPVIINSGGAHYTIRFPIDIRLVRIYNMNGAKVMERYFKNTDTVNLDMSALPVGFYVMMALGEDGTVYGMKLFR